MTDKPRVLEHKLNVYRSVEITDASVGSPEMRRKALGLSAAMALPAADPVVFERDLWHSLRVWKKEKCKGVWLKLDITAADLVPVAVRAGFEFHRAEPSCITLTAWLDKESENKLPPGPNHFVGVAGFVLNSKNQVLCVKEKSGPSARLSDFVKLPGGLADNGEDLCDAAVREVKEETGLDTVFERIATIQEIHHSAKYGGPAREGTTDLYCICILRAVDENQELVPQESEIAECRWVPLDEFLNLRYYNVQGTVYYKMFRTAAQVALAHSQGLEQEHLRFGFNDTKNRLYSSRLIPESKL